MPDGCPDPDPGPIPWYMWITFILLALLVGLLVYALPGWGA